QYESLRSPSSVKLLCDLAQHGARLHESIHNHNEVSEHLAEEPRLQIITARYDGFLPLELAYRYEAPDDDAELCPGSEAALEQGACPASCGVERGTSRRLCPLGFWCTWKTIERFAHRAEFIDENADYSLLAEPIGGRPTLPHPSACVVAASAKAEEF